MMSDRHRLLAAVFIVFTLFVMGIAMYEIQATVAEVLAASSASASPPPTPSEPAVPFDPRM